METENIFLDYEKGILLVNGEKTRTPVRVILKTGDGRDKAKFVNFEKNLTPESTELIAEVIVDVCGLIPQIIIPYRCRGTILYGININSSICMKLHAH